MSSNEAPQSGPVTTEISGPVAVARIDDGKVNAISVVIIEQLHALLDRADEGDVGAVAVVGRAGRFSAGFDLSVMQSSPSEARDLVHAGGDLAIRIYTFPKPVVLGCTGHAIAMGAVLLLAADARTGARGDFKIGLNEVAIGMPLPRFAVELARDRLSKRHFVPACAHAHLYDPTGAVEAGFLDALVEPADVDAAAIAHAAHLAGTLKQGAFRMTRDNMRSEVAEALRRGIDDDMKLFNIEA